MLEPSKDKEETLTFLAMHFAYTRSITDQKNANAHAISTAVLANARWLLTVLMHGGSLVASKATEARIFITVRREDVCYG